MRLSLKYIGVLLIVALCLSAVYTVWQQNWSNLFVIIQAIILSIIPYVLEYRYDIHISEKLRVGIVAFIFSTLFLGEINHFYDQYYWWDAALHFMAGVGLTLVGFVLLSAIYTMSNLRSTPALTTLFAFSFTAMVASLWEVYEFSIDQLGWAENLMQVNGTETMIDIIVSFVGSLIVCIGGYRYLKRGEKNQAGQILDEMC